MKEAQLRFHFGRKCLAIRHRLLTEFFPPIESARQESNRAHGFLERTHARLVRCACLQGVRTETSLGRAQRSSASKCVRVMEGQDDGKRFERRRSQNSKSNSEAEDDPRTPESR